MFLVLYCMVLSVKNAPVICVISGVYIGSLGVKTLTETKQTHLLDSSSEVTNNYYLHDTLLVRGIQFGPIHKILEKLINLFSDVLNIC